MKTIQVTPIEFYLFRQLANFLYDAHFITVGIGGRGTVFKLLVLK